MVTHFNATLGIGGCYTLPNRDFHPVRNIELLGALPLKVNELLTWLVHLLYLPNLKVKY